MSPQHPCAHDMSDMTVRGVGYGGTAPSPSSELLTVATAMASSLLLGPGAVARVTRTAVFLPRAPGLRETVGRPIRYS